MLEECDHPAFGQKRQGPLQFCKCQIFICERERIDLVMNQDCIKIHKPNNIGPYYPISVHIQAPVLRFPFCASRRSNFSATFHLDGDELRIVGLWHLQLHSLQVEAWPLFPLLGERMAMPTGPSPRRRWSSGRSRWASPWWRSGALVGAAGPPRASRRAP